MCPRIAQIVALAAAGFTPAACDTVAIGPPLADVNACRPSPAFFIDQVWPNFLAKDYGGKRCSDARCHDVGSGRLLVLAPPTSQPAIPLPPDWAAVYKSASEQTECTHVRSSALLARPAGLQTHGGGKLIDVDGPEAVILQMWVAAK